MQSPNTRLEHPVITRRQQPVPPTAKEIRKQANRFYYQLNKDKWSNLQPSAYNASYLREYHQKKYEKSPSYRKYMSQATMRSRDWRLGNTKECKHCEVMKAMSDFPMAKDKRNKHRNIRKTYCRMCRSAINAKAYQRRIQP